MKGDVKSNWVNVGVQKITQESDVEEIVKLRKKKYGFSARLISMFTSQKGKTVAYSIVARDGQLLKTFSSFLETFKYNSKLQHHYLGTSRSFCKCN